MRKAAARRVPPGLVHEALVQPGSARSVYGPNAPRLADLRNPRHYPLVAVCGVPGCRQVVRRQKIAPDQMDWEHTGRMAGDPR